MLIDNNPGLGLLMGDAPSENALVNDDKWDIKKGGKPVSPAVNS